MSFVLLFFYLKKPKTKQKKKTKQIFRDASGIQDDFKPPSHLFPLHLSRLRVGTHLLFVDVLGLLHLLLHFVDALPQDFDLLLGLQRFAPHLRQHALLAAPLQLLLGQPPAEQSGRCPFGV